MSKKILLCLILMSVNAFSSENFMEFGDVNFGRNFKEKSKWLLKSGAEYIKYPYVLPEYKGEHEKFGEDEFDELNGYGLGVGRDFYLGNGFSSLVSINLYYSKTLDKTIGKAAEDIDFDYSSTRIAHEMYAAEASLALNYIYDFKVVDVQPFIEVGFGLGQNEIQIEYSTVGLTGEDNSSEDYDVTVTEEFAITRASVGVNFISYKGLMSYFKFTAMGIVKANRESVGESNLRGDSTIVKYDENETSLNESETISMISIGIGRYF